MGQSISLKHNQSVWFLAHFSAILCCQSSDAVLQSTSLQASLI